MPTVSVNVPAASKVLLVSSAAVVPEVTIRRTIVSLRVISDQVAATELQVGALGAHVANNVAVAAGVGSLLGPVTERDSEAWFMWMPINQQHIRESTLGFDSDGGHLYSFESRGQRKLQTGETVVFVVENAHATHGFEVQLAVSMLAGSGLKR